MANRAKTAIAGANINVSNVELIPAIGTDDVSVAESQFRRLIVSMGIHTGMDEEHVQEKISNALSLMRSLKPQNLVEGKLAAQWVATCEAAEDCLRQASFPELSIETKNIYFRVYKDLMQLSLKQLEALQRLRGKAQQKVIVEHVHVEAGGQAIVGSVAHSGK